MLVLQAGNTKSHEPIEFPLPELLTPYLTRYLEHYRLLFRKADASDALWLSAKGGALGAEAIYEQICQRTEATFGFAVSPHLFRDCAVTTIARESPELLAVARDLLTHAKIETTLRYYSQAKTVDAARKHSMVIDRLRSARGTSQARVARTQESDERTTGESRMSINRGRTEC